MSRITNYVRPIHLSLQVLSEVGIDRFPINLKQILRHYGIHLMSYEAYSARLECSLPVCFKQFGNDGATLAKNGKYLIVYNSQQSAKDRIRFTIAHELGHIILRHHDELGVDILQRMWVEKNLYEVLEDEANCFARNLLCPAVAVQEVLRAHGFVATRFDSAQERNIWFKVASAPCLPNLPKNLTDYYLVKQSFQVTSTAAKTRCHFLKSDLRNMPGHQANALMERAIFTAQWRCTKCGALRMKDVEYCYYCGTKNCYSLISMETPEPKPIFLRYNGNRFSSCPVCGNADILPDANYCHICGNTVANPCTCWRKKNRSIMHLLELAGKGSVHLNPPGCRYCQTCGSKTLHGLQQIALYDYILTRGYRFSEIETDDQGGLPTVKYGPNIPSTNANDEFRVQRCPKCLNEDNDGDADFCIICGNSLLNLCDGIEPDFQGRIHYHSNPANARFCRICGKPTENSRLPILRNYQDQLKHQDNRMAVLRELEDMDIDEDLFWQMNGIEGTEKFSSHLVNVNDDEEFPFSFSGGMSDH